MPAEDRERRILRFYAENFPLPPKAVYRALKVEEDIDFSYRTVQNILSRLNERGEVMRVNKDALDEGRIEALSPDETGRRTYYYITREGRDRLEASK